MIIKYYFIRHNPTGYFLPEPTGRMGRGGSHVEPTNPGERMPRLFHSKLSAQRALSSWLRGRVHHRCGYSHDWEGNRDDYEENEIEKVPSRKKEEMEIIEREITL